MLRSWLAVAAVASLALLLGTSAAAGGGCYTQDQTTTQGQGTAIDISKCKFNPVVLFAPVGATVTWAQDDQVPHNVLGIGWGTGNYVPSGGSYQHTFDKPGIYPYHCSLHPDMSGVIVVGDTALSAASAAAATPAAPGALVAGVASQRGGLDAAWLALGAALAAAAGAIGFALGSRRRTPA